MIAYKEKDRITLQEIKQHPWYTDPKVPSQEELAMMFTKRKATISEQQELEKVAKNVEKMRVGGKNAKAKKLRKG